MKGAGKRVQKHQGTRSLGPRGLCVYMRPSQPIPCRASQPRFRDRKEESSICTPAQELF